MEGPELSAHTGLSLLPVPGLSWVPVCTAWELGVHTGVLIPVPGGGGGWGGWIMSSLCRLPSNGSCVAQPSEGQSRRPKWPKVAGD